MFSQAMLLNGNGDGVLREAMNKVRGAIEWVDDPEPLLFATLASLKARLFCLNRVRWIGFAYELNNGAFSGFIDLSYVVIQAFGFDIDEVETIGGLSDDVGGQVSGAQRHGQHGLHGTDSDKERLRRIV